MPLAESNAGTFADGETSVRLAASVRGKDVFIVQPTCPPVSENLMELLLMITAARRASADSVTAVIPYYGYKRDTGRNYTAIANERAWLRSTLQEAASAPGRGDKARAVFGSKTLPASRSKGRRQRGSRGQVGTADPGTAGAATSGGKQGSREVVGRDEGGVEDDGHGSGLDAGTVLPHSPWEVVLQLRAETETETETDADAESGRDQPEGHPEFSDQDPSASEAAFRHSAQSQLDALSSVPISAADVAHLLEVAGVDAVLTLDLQPPGSGQVEGFFSPRTAVESLRGAPLAIDHIVRQGLQRPVVVAPNETCVHLARDFRSGLQQRLREQAEEEAALAARRAEVPPAEAMAAAHAVGEAAAEAVGLAVVTESSRSAGANRYEHEGPGEHGAGSRDILTLSLLGDVRGRDVVIVDDMVDSAGTLLRTVRLLKRKGAKRVLAFATHGVFSGEALRRISQSPLEEMLVTDSVPLVRRGDAHQRKLAAASCRKISQLSCAPLLAEAMARMHCSDSL